MRVDVNVTKVFDRAEATRSRINLFRGGTGSSKSYSMSQNFVINKFCKQTGKTFIIARKTLPALRKTALFETMKMIQAWGIPYNLNKSELELKIHGNTCYFMGLDQPGKAASLQSDDVWLEEIVDFTFEDFRQFEMRMNGQLYGTFNPISGLHWIKKDVIDSRNYDLYEDVSTYRDNPYLPEPRRKSIENLVNGDENFYKIYNLGEWGTLGETIYSFSTVDMPREFDDVSFGIDFGFNNPSTVMRVYWIDGRVVWQEVLYQSGLTNTDLIAQIKEAVTPEELSCNWYADTAEPARIEEFYRAGFNIYPADKSVKDGIDFCKVHVIGITKDSVNAIKERQSYSYKKDKDGNVLEEPVKAYDHCMDAGRYGTYKQGMEATPNIIILGE